MASPYEGSTFTAVPSAVGADPAVTKPTYDPNVVEAYGAGSTGRNIPAHDMYAGYHTAVGPHGTVSMSAEALGNSLKLNVYDPWGPGVRPEGGREYVGSWINPYDKNLYGGVSGSMPGATGGRYMDGDNLFKYNQFFMTVAQSFDPFMQKKLAEAPHWWINRIPRGAFQLFNGSVQETRIFRGGLGHYAGLADWEDLAPDPTVKDACGPVRFKTYQYAWETLAWSGKKTAWGSDPICIEVLKFVQQAREQIGWVIEQGVKFGMDFLNVWNRDMFIYFTVQANRSYVMTSAYRGASSPRFFYDPFVKFGDVAAAGTASKAYVDKPFIVIDATEDLEPLNFDVLDIVRGQLKRRCPESRVGMIGNEPMFALAISQEDVEKYIRGNEEERRYWIEANPQALIQHFGFAPTTFRRWTVTCDDDQLRFKLKRYIPDYTTDEARNYGDVALDIAGKNKAVWIAEYVPPMIGGRPGINGSAVPVPNPEYDLAEIAIAPVFMNKIFTNLFVPDVTNLGSGTWFGPKQGLNGKWAWYNIQTPENPDQKIGNFKGEFQIVPKPDVCVFDCISFVYRRCAEPLPALCPVENTRINPAANNAGSGKATTVKHAATSKTKGGAYVLDLEFDDAIIASVGAVLKFTATKFADADSDDSFDSGESSTSTTAEVTAMVFESLTGTHKKVQVVADVEDGYEYYVAKGADVTVL